MTAQLNDLLIAERQGIVGHISVSDIVNLSQDVVTFSEKDVQAVLNVVPVSGNFYTLDATQSTYDFNVTGGQLGRHEYQVSTIRQVLDLDSTPLSPTTIAGANVTFDGNDSYEKNIEGNSWNAWFQSENVLGNAATEDFAVTWLVESVTGTIREMGGLDENPSLNASYSSGEYMIYQVNGNIVYFYENGSNKGNQTIQLAVNDRLGIRVDRGVVSYIHLRGGLETVLYVSDKKTSLPFYFKGAFNRGSTSSGVSEMGRLQVYNQTVGQPVSVRVAGAATEVINQYDIDRLLDVGLVADETSVYSSLVVEKLDNAYFLSGEARNIVHGYSVSTAQATATL